MKKYSVFRHQMPIQQPNPQDSAEATACEIVRVALSDCLPMGFYTACDADSPESTFQALQTPAICTVQLDGSRIEKWHKEVLPVVDSLASLSDAIDQARYTISDSLHELSTAAEGNEIFADFDFIGNINLDYGFSYIESPPLGDISQRLCELFDVKFLAHAEQD